MDTFWNVLGFFGSLVVLGLAIVGSISLVSLLTGGEHHAAVRRAQRAEEQIAEIGRQAQVAILGEALRRIAQRRPATAASGGQLFDPRDQEGEGR